MDEQGLLDRIVVNPQILGGKPIIRGHRMSVENVLGMLAAGSTEQELLEGYEWLELADIKACLLYAAMHVGNEYYEPRFVEPSDETAA